MGIYILCQDICALLKFVFLKVNARIINADAVDLWCFNLLRVQRGMLSSPEKCKQYCYQLLEHWLEIKRTQVRRYEISSSGFDFFSF